jgi:hypothetical protein
MKHFVLMGTALSLLVLTSCKNETSETEATTLETTEQAQPSTITTTPPVNSKPSGTAATPAPQGERPKLNPPHGQPFHRCDIAVGAPLDGSAPAPNSTAPTAAKSEPRTFFKTVQSEQPTQAQPQQPAMTQATPTPTPTPQQTANTGQKPKLNPAHGQPFHRCDIAVGAPLPG